MKILYVKSDYSDYKQGNYYEEWSRYFEREFDLTTLYLDKISQNQLLDSWESFDAIIYGHSCFDFHKDFYLKSGAFSLYVLARRTRAFGKSRRVILFSKNDYKAFDQKKQFARLIGANKIITHTKHAVNLFGSICDIAYSPFFADPEKYFDMRQGREIFLGFRGNLNSKWNFGTRSVFLDYIMTLGIPKIEVHATEYDGSVFLHGKQYNDWLNRCITNFFSCSALGTVGPKFYEMALSGVVPVAPYDWYEGLLFPYEHYIPITLDTKTNDLFNDIDNPTLIERIKDNNKRMSNWDSIQSEIRKIVTL